MSEKLFRVRWEIDLAASTPADAARQALAIHRDPGSLATFFDVRRIRLDGTKGKRHVIDTLDQWVATNAPDNEGDYAAAELRAVAAAIVDDTSSDTPTDSVNPAVNPLTRVVDGVTYKKVPEVKSLSCTGCVAQKDYPLCLVLDSSEGVYEGGCFHDNVIWAVSESKPETPPPPKRGTVRDPSTRPLKPTADDDFFVVDEVVYERVKEADWSSCKGCVAYDNGSYLPLCGRLSGTCSIRHTIWKLAGDSAALYDGKLYKAVEHVGCSGCVGLCELMGDDHPPCADYARDDGRNIIFVEVQK